MNKRNMRERQAGCQSNRLGPGFTFNEDMHRPRTSQPELGYGLAVVRDNFLASFTIFTFFVTSDRN